MAILAGALTPMVTAETTEADSAVADLMDLAAPGFCEALEDQGLYVEVAFVARDAANSVASGKTAATLKIVGGALSLIASTPLHFSNSDLAIGGFALAADGSRLQASFSGIAATIIGWKFHSRFWSD